jgi:hypothetical protein
MKAAVRSLPPHRQRINLPHDSLGPLHGSRNHRLCSRTRTIVKQVFRRFQVTGHQNARHESRARVCGLRPFGNSR